MDLLDRLLKPRGLILLSHFQFYCEPMTLRADRRISLIWELTDVNVVDWIDPDILRNVDLRRNRLTRGGD